MPIGGPSVLSIAVQGDGKILAGGQHTDVGGQPRGGLFARLIVTTLRRCKMCRHANYRYLDACGARARCWRALAFEAVHRRRELHSLGNSGTATGSNWTLTGLSLPTGQNIYIRARWLYRGGYLSSSEEHHGNQWAMLLSLLGRTPVSIRTRTARFASSSCNRTARSLSAAILQRSRPTVERRSRATTLPG